eukprot:CAMPEP_0182918906 /NCGR_PEP_ID=MMETSP0105_2-20130417/2363_1 /TAXON_ID=81532 ORGANISM="Acanthoeca-like sp., Strain 10tr" /NCGR_SAMPLE_ID=MMETSP0105_2 /ASSEMBLY_ACC=CAM_ASM_000205 /LENGTH=58 /DNA_ID=CAMNT_0025056029 /DNA_START=126 /DNA_END=302 /DNA_ORIENTATION=-
MTIQHLANNHIRAINLWALFSIYLNVDEGVIKLRRNLVILKALVSHHVAPMACCITNG